MATSDIPEPWAGAMEKVGAVSPQTGRASLNRLSEMAGVHTTTISNLVKGRTRVPDLDTISSIANALRLQPRVVAGWLDVVWGENPPYEPPSEAALLDQRERDLVDEMIRVIARLKAPRPETTPHVITGPAVANQPPSISAKKKK